MQATFKMTLLAAMLLVHGSVFAGEPIINYNVPVIQNTDASHCPATFDGDTNNDMVTDMSGYGLDSGIAAAGIESCTGCAYDSGSHNCVCKTCYGYYN